MRSRLNAPLVEAFATELKLRRNAMGLSQEALADACEVNRTFIAKLELGQNQPTLSVLFAIANGLAVDLPDLLNATLVRRKKLLRAAGRSEQH